jgi:hypothetical protein
MAVLYLVLLLPWLATMFNKQWLMAHDKKW